MLFSLDVSVHPSPVPDGSNLNSVWRLDVGAESVEDVEVDELDEADKETDEDAIHARSIQTRKYKVRGQ